jgi:hypothetical protein
MAAPQTWAALAAGGGAELPAPAAAELAELQLAPLDAHNAALLDHVHPLGWIDPAADGVVYDLLALGAGAGGLVSAKQTARRGGRSALVSARMNTVLLSCMGGRLTESAAAQVEVHLHGGDCLNVGCVPSKALIRAARAVREARRAMEFGVSVGEVTIDFPFIMVPAARPPRLLLPDVVYCCILMPADTRAATACG